MNPAKKKVLIITYYFPPSGGAGVQRTLKFVKYLREFGWEPVVLTANEADYPVSDPALFEEVPQGVKVYRSRIIEPYRWYRKFTGREASESTDIATLTLDEKEKRRVRERVSEWVRATFFVPDARIGWLPFAYRMGRQILRSENIQVIFSSAPPYTTHLIGLKLHKQSHLPWVADFRDSWIGWVSAPQWRPAISRAIEKRMEASVLQQADRILTVSQGVKEDLLSRHTRVREARWQLLPNGFDASDFEKVQPAANKSAWTLTYSGSLYGPRHPEYLLQALESLQKEKPKLLEKFCLRFIGRLGKPILERIQVSPVRRLIEVVPYLTHKESLAYLLASDVLLLIIDDAPANKGILTGKLFEYIGAGKPILALAPEGEAADLIYANHLGWVAPPKDRAAIQKVLQHILEKRNSGEWMKMTPSPRLQKFERRHQAGELAKILEGLT
ncbi:MAG: glycosyltransferase family 4 protein [bacterium]